MDSMAVVVTCINKKDHTDVDPSIEGFFNSYTDARNMIDEFNKNNCKTSSIFNILVESYQRDLNLTYEKAVKYFESNYLLIPLIVGLPDKTNSTFH
jgi:hypothetical protein